jgi:hypothetical protein
MQTAQMPTDTTGPLGVAGGFVGSGTIADSPSMSRHS